VFRRTQVLRGGPHALLSLVSFARLKANAGIQTDRSAR
jgi:hypothetical protein